uniref:GM09828p n=1 Tax=Drosophila melanogaster TaxID=7227 RepID=Q6NP63_DROME|nr:GM09828p [Drosophila melanogaster]
MEATPPPIDFSLQLPSLFCQFFKRQEPTAMMMLMCVPQYLIFPIYPKMCVIKSFRLYNSILNCCSYVSVACFPLEK